MYKLILGDCIKELKKLPDKSIDMLLTDPPYGMSFVSNHRKEKYKKIENDSNLDWLDDFVSEIHRISKDNTAHYVFTSYHNIDIFKQAFEKKFKVKNILTWVKNNTSMGDLKADFAPQTEFVIFLHKGRRFINGRRDSNVLNYARTGNKLHPTQKPVDLLEFLIEKFSDEGQTVIDPFMGSGSTGVACLNKNRSFIGIELDQAYYDISSSRLAEFNKPFISSTQSEG